jgi:hypothetical protein
MSFLPDMTLDDVSIFREPLVARNGIRNSIDNPYGTAHEHLSSWLEAAALLSVFASLLLPSGSPKEKVERLREAIDTFHGASTVQPDCYFASRVVVLLSSMYPTCFSISRESIEIAYAQAAGPATTAFKQERPSCLCDLVDAELEADGRRYWLSFGWSRLAPMLEELVRMDGSCDLTLGQIGNFKSLVDDAIRAAWDVSLDHEGKPRDYHPLQGLKSAEEINSQHVSPVFAQQLDGTYPRGALVGMKPGSFRSLLCLLLGADQVQEVQVYRNEGGLLLRPSSAADIFDINGRPRTAKSCSPVGVEGDEGAYGSRDAKLLGCHLQRAAWERNLRLLMPLCVNIRAPLPEEVRRRGDAAVQRGIIANERRLQTTGVTSAERKEARLVAKIVLDTL